MERRPHSEELKIVQGYKPFLPEPKNVLERTEKQESAASWLRKRRRHLFSKSFEEGRIKNGYSG